MQRKLRLKLDALSTVIKPDGEYHMNRRRFEDLSTYALKQKTIGPTRERIIATHLSL